MPITFSDNTSKSLALLNNAIRGIPYSISTDSNPYNINGVCQGELIGGNLSILYSLLGTNDQIDYEGKILFIEDLDEFLYHIDHMLFSFQKADIFSKINGLIVGGMTNLRDTSNNFGINIYEIILKQFQDKKIPIAFDFPSGHIDDNIPMVMGKKVELSVLEKTKLRWI
jgi:muramoyltetrapeptide carboxypeptidase